MVRWDGQEKLPGEEAPNEIRIISGRADTASFPNPKNLLT